MFTQLKHVPAGTMVWSGCIKRWCERSVAIVFPCPFISSSSDYTAAHACRYSGLTLAKNLVMIMTGILTGLVGVAISHNVKGLMAVRNACMAHILEHSGSFTQAFIFNIAYGIVLVTAAACMVC